MSPEFFVDSIGVSFLSDSQERFYEWRQFEENNNPKKSRFFHENDEAQIKIRINNFQ